MEGSDYINASFIDVSSYIFSSKNHVLLRHAVFLTQGYPDKKKAYIASQGATFDLPVQCSSFFTTCFSSSIIVCAFPWSGPTELTVGRFWEMIWEYQVPTIVMLTHCVESARVSLFPITFLFHPPLLLAQAY